LLSIVVAIGPGVKSVKEGDHIVHISTASDPMVPRDIRYRFIREQHILMFWDPNDIPATP
jgi:hypothetical protein